MRRLFVFVTMVAVACSSTPSVEAFCAQVIPILSRDDLGDGPAAMQRQMDDLATAVEHLPSDELHELRKQIETLNAEWILPFRAWPRTDGPMRRSPTPSARSAAMTT